MPSTLRPSASLTAPLSMRRLAVLDAPPDLVAHAVHLARDGDATGLELEHAGMNVADRVEPINWRGEERTEERRTVEVVMQLEAAHQRSVHEQLDRHLRHRRQRGAGQYLRSDLFPYGVRGARLPKPAIHCSGLGGGNVPLDVKYLYLNFITIYVQSLRHPAQLQAGGRSERRRAPGDVQSSLPPTKVDRYIDAFRPSDLRQALPEPREFTCVGYLRAAAEEPNCVQRLLRPRRGRPREGRAAEKCNELAPPHFLLPPPGT